MKWFIRKSILPATGAVGLALMFGGVICPIGGLVKLIGALFGYDLPVSLFDIGSFHMPLALGLLLSVVVGIALFFAGRASWKVTKKYLAWICKMKQNMLEKKEA